MFSQESATPAGGDLQEMQWASTQLGAIWAQLAAQITPFVHVLSIPGDLYRSFDGEAKFTIAQNFMASTGESVLFCRDGTGPDRYFLGNPRHFLQDGGVIVAVAGHEPFWFMREQAATCHQSVTTIAPIQPPKPKDKKIPRPPNAYILYRKERHNAVKQANPGITNNEISQILGMAWNRESREVRQQYKEMSEAIKTALMKKHPDYQYKPRKPSEKKRRNRKGNQPGECQQMGIEAQTPSVDGTTYGGPQVIDFTTTT